MLITSFLHILLPKRWNPLLIGFKVFFLLPLPEIYSWVSPTPAHPPETLPAPYSLCQPLLASLSRKDGWWPCESPTRSASILLSNVPPAPASPLVSLCRLLGVTSANPLLTLAHRMLSTPPSLCLQGLEAWVLAQHNTASAPSCATYRARTNRITWIQLFGSWTMERAEGLPGLPTTTKCDYGVHQLGDTSLTPKLPSPSHSATALEWKARLPQAWSCPVFREIIFLVVCPYPPRLHLSERNECLEMEAPPPHCSGAHLKNLHPPSLRKRPATSVTVPCVFHHLASGDSYNAILYNFTGN